MRLQTDFGHVVLPEGLAPEALAHGRGNIPLGVKWREMKPAERLMLEGVARTKMPVPKLQEALAELKVEFEYDSWNKEARIEKDRMCFVKSLWGILEIGEEIQV